MEVKKFLARNAYKGSDSNYYIYPWLLLDSIREAKVMAVIRPSFFQRHSISTISYRIRQMSTSHLKGSPLN